MQKNNWIRKITSRKFWAAITAVILAILAFFNVPEMTQSQITTLIAAIGTLVIYIFGESIIDAAAVKKDKEDENDGTRSE